MVDSINLTWREKITALTRVALYRPVFTIGIIVLGGLVASMEGLGLGFIYPILEVAQSEGPVEQGGPVLNIFLDTYEFLNIPFSLGYLILGVGLVMTVRYTMSFLITWLRAILAKQYERDLRTQEFGRVAKSSRVQ